MAVHITESAHWYRQTGPRPVDAAPCHTIECKTKPGVMKNTNLGDAKREGLFPSPSGILKCIPKGGALDDWKLQNVIEMALTTPRKKNETDQEFVQRVAEEAHAHMKLAADLGTRTHAAIEDWIEEGSGCSDPDVAPMLDVYQKWHTANVARVLMVEQPFIGNGYGGCCDMVAVIGGRVCVVDWKTQGAKPKKKMRAWETYGYQLAAYGLALAPDADLLNVMISTAPDDRRVEVIDHTPDKERLVEVWQSAIDLWCKHNRHDLRKDA